MKGVTLTAYGLDFSWGRPSVASIKAGGYSFVCRYLAWSSGKVINSYEASAYLSNGIDVFLNWEWDAQDALRGAAGGIVDATEAIRQAKVLGYPRGAEIIFSADWDITDAEKPVVAAYTREVQRLCHAAGYRNSTYGSYWCVKYLFDAKLIDNGWQTYAWSGGNWDPRAGMRQIQNGITVGGADCDRNQTAGPVYGWLHPYGGTPAAPAPAPAPAPVPTKVYTYPYQVIVDILKYLPAPYQVTDTTRSLNGPIANGTWDYHVGNAAVDFAGTAEQMRDNAAFLYKYSAYLRELIHTTPFSTDNGFYVKNYAKQGEGFYGAATNAAHMNHVHVAIDSMAQAKALLALLTPKTAPIPPKPIEWSEEDVKDLLIAQDGVGGPIFVGNGLYRRWIRDSAALGNFMWWYHKLGGVQTESHVFVKGTVEDVLGTVVGDKPTDYTR